MKVFISLLIFCFSSVLLSQNDDEKYLSKLNYLKYYYHDDDMEIISNSDDFEPSELNKIYKYAKGDLMIFSDKTFSLTSILDYTYNISEEFIIKIDTIKPLTKLFEKIYNYDTSLVHGNFAIVTKGRSDRYNVYIDRAPSCLPNIMGMSYEEQRKYNLKNRYQLYDSSNIIENKPFKDCNIRTLDDIKTRREREKHNVYYKDINGLYRSFLGTYDYIDSIQRLEVKVVKKVKKKYLRSDSRKSYFIDKLEIIVKHWKNEKLIFDSTNSNESGFVISSIINEDYDSYGMKFIVYLKTESSIYLKPLLKLSLREKGNNLSFNADYSYNKNTYSTRTKNKEYDFPQYITLKKYNFIDGDKNYIDDSDDKKSVLNKDVIQNTKDMLYGKWKLSLGKGPEELEFLKNKSYNVIVSGIERVYQMYYHNGFKMRIYSNESNDFDLEIEKSRLILKNLDTNEQIIYKRD